MSVTDAHRPVGGIPFFQVLTWFGESWDRFCHLRGFTNAGFILSADAEHVGLAFRQVLDLCNRRKRKSKLK